MVVKHKPKAGSKLTGTEYEADDAHIVELEAGEIPDLSASYDAAGTAAGLIAGYGDIVTHDASEFQSADSDLTAIAALSTTSYGRGLLELEGQAAAKVAIGIGDVWAADYDLDLTGSDASGNTTKLQAAIDDTQAGGTLHLPAGYIAHGALTRSSGALRIVGAGFASSYQAPFGTGGWLTTSNHGGTVLLSTVTSGASIYFSANHERFELADLMLIGPGSGTSTGVQVMSGGSDYSLQSVWCNVEVANFSVGVALNFCEEWSVYSLSLRGNVNGLVLDKGTNQNAFYNTTLEFNSGIGIKFIDADLNCFYGGLLQEITGTAGVWTSDASTSQQAIFDGWYIEAVTATWAFDFQYGHHHALTNSHFSSTGGANRCDGSNCRFQNINVSVAGPTMLNEWGVNNVYENVALAITLSATSSGCTVSGRGIVGTPAYATADRPSPASRAGSLIYDTTVAAPAYSDGSAWSVLGGVSMATDPVVNGLLAWTFDPIACSTSRTPAAAKIYLVKIMVPRTITIANLLIYCSTAGNSYTNTQLGVYSSAGVLLGASAVLASGGTNTFGATGVKTVPITVIDGQSLTIVGSPTRFVWAAIHMGTNSTTAAQFRGPAANDPPVNAGLAAATYRFCRQDGHATNDLATIGNLTPANNVLDGAALANYWFGVA